MLLKVIGNQRQIVANTMAGEKKTTTTRTHDWNKIETKKEKCRGGDGQMFSRRARVDWRLGQRFVAHPTTRAHSQMVLATSLPRILT